eukprot:COSAG02_NODE_2369_length_9049_cov_37.484358_4_plen_61_part_00
MPGVSLRRPGMPVGPGAWDWAYLWVLALVRGDNGHKGRMPVISGGEFRARPVVQCRLMTV